MGNSTLVTSLRALVCMELFIHANFYANHPLFELIFESNKSLFSSTSTLLPMCISNEAFNEADYIDCIRKEALCMCYDKVWASFLCVLAMSSILKRKLTVHYPDFGPLKYRILFNQEIMPRCFYDDHNMLTNSNAIKILYCSLTTSTTSSFFANHFVPLVERKPDKVSVNFLKRTVDITSSFSAKRRKVKLPSSESFYFNYPKLHSFFPSLSKQSDTSHYSNTKTFSVSSTNTTSTLTTSVSNSACNTSTKNVTKVLSSILNITPASSNSCSKASHTFAKPSSFSLASSFSSTSSCSSSSSSSPASSYTTSSSSTTFSSSSSSSSSTSTSSTTSISSTSSNFKENDMSYFYNIATTLNDTERHRLICNVFSPDKKFKFPKNQSGRCFQYEWLTTFSWLKYSKKEVVTVFHVLCLQNKFHLHSSVSVY